MQTETCMQTIARFSAGAHVKPEAGGVTCGVGRLSVEAPRIDPGFVWRETRRDDDADDGRTGRTPRRRTRCCCTPHYATVGLPMKTSASDEAVRETFVASENDAAQECIATTGRHRRRRRRSRCEHKHLSSSFGGSACVMQSMARRGDKKGDQEMQERQAEETQRVGTGPTEWFAGMTVWRRRWAGRPSGLTRQQAGGARRGRHS